MNFNEDDSIRDYVFDKTYISLMKNNKFERANRYKYDRIDKWISEKCPTPITSEAANKLFILLDSHRYYEYFERLANREWETKAFCEKLTDTYTMDGYGHHEQYKEWFHRFDRQYLKEDDANAYDKLQETVRVFRGCSIDEALNGVTSLSWTTDFKVALFFAYRHGTEGRCVIEAMVSKESIIAYFEDRSESECIITEPIDYDIINK